jgi:transposase
MANGPSSTPCSQTFQTRTAPTDLRRILDGILDVIKGRTPWRYLPTDFPPRKTVYHVFGKWSLNYQRAALNDALRTLVRKADGKAQPTHGGHPGQPECEIRWSWWQRWL